MGTYKSKGNREIKIINEPKQIKMPIKTFEEITHELTDIELEIVPFVVAILQKTKGKNNSIKNESLKHKACTDHQIRKCLKKPVKMGPSRLRKIINYIRTTNLIPVLCASSKGYFVGQNAEEIENYIQSNQERANEILQMNRHIRIQYRQWKINKLAK